MAATKKIQSHRYLGSVETLTPPDNHHQFEFDESEVWSTEYDHPTESATTKKTAANNHGNNPRLIRKPVRKSGGASVDRAHISARSLPVNVPDWSKILRGEYRPRVDRYEVCDDEDGEESGDDRMPPHEYLARTRVASLSVHEGVGRTLKGRDLSRVRNAIWKKTGFELD